MAEIGHYNYENVDLRVKAAWLEGAPGGSADPLPAKLKAIADAFDMSNVRLTANIEALGASWQGQAAETAQASMRRASQRNAAAHDANERGSAAVTEYGVSFEEMRRKVHFEDPNATWQPAPAPGAAVPGDPFAAQVDQFDPMQKHRTADAAANAALRAHEQRTRELVDRFPTLDPAPVAPQGNSAAPGGIGGVPTGGGTGGAHSAGSTPAAVVPPTGGSDGGGSRSGPSGAGPNPYPNPTANPGPDPKKGTGGYAGSVAPPQAVPPPDGGRTHPGHVAPGGNNGATSGGLHAPSPIGVGVTAPPGSSTGRAAPPGPGNATNRVTVGSPGDGRQFSSRLPVIAEPTPGPARPAPTGPPATQPAGRTSTSMYPPMMGGAGAAGGPTTRQRKYWVPTSEAFEVDLPPHVDGVVGADPEDAR